MDLQLKLQKQNFESLRLTPYNKNDLKFRSLKVAYTPKITLLPLNISQIYYICTVMLSRIDATLVTTVQWQMVLWPIIIKYFLTSYSFL